MAQNNKKAPKTQMVFDFNTPKGREEAVEKFLGELHKQNFTRDEAIICSYKGCAHSLSLGKGPSKTITMCLANILNNYHELSAPAMMLAAILAQAEREKDDDE